ncbi:hypothetical protein Xen7305DRAFT_00047440 [Xenococcus sp. PCC 7305]|uniref:DUF952 domain-containing protein n=1 Tax=Xenococcus sp. PCC 7305 TaxID=102125 RepID=UPI0002ACB2C5|nr:DUF952 domain-containing protein [Xenococcus sp. PCC 7305]ELS05006.1 hypothetical protein Xen7305DRAFT_00047440 [Xenococcus sp. PCC 7305]
MSDRIIYHITSAQEWDLAQSQGEYEPRQFAAEGFIHCSHAHQLEAVMKRFFQGQTDLVVLEINSAALKCDVIEENLEGGAELYPHIYGKLPLDAVIDCKYF